ANSIQARNRLAQTVANHKFGPRFHEASRSTRNQRRFANRTEVWPVGRRESAHPWLEIASTAAFRRRAAPSRGEDRPPAEWQRPLRTPAVAPIAVPADPWPAQGASWMRDSTPGRTSRAGIEKPH